MRFVGIGFGLVLGVVSLLVSPLWAMSGLISILMFVLIGFKPELGFLIIVFLVSGLVNVDERHLLLTIGPISFYVTDIILLYLLALVLAKAIALPRFKLIRTPLDVPLIWFYCAVLLSAFVAVAYFSVDPHWVLRRLRQVTYYLGFFAVTNLIRDRQQLKTLIIGILVIAVLGSIMMLFQVIDPSIQLAKTRTKELMTAGREYTGVERTYMQVDRLIYPMLLFSICSVNFRARWLPLVLELTGICILSVGLFLTFQRNYWLTMISMLVLLGMLASWRERIRILKWVIVGMVVLTLSVPLTWHYTGNYITAAYDRIMFGMQPNTLVKDESTQWRVMETRYAIQSISKHPLLGIGLGNFYRPEMFGNESQYFPDKPNYGVRWYIHNAYLWVLIDAGLIGFIPFIWLFLAFLLRGFTRWRKIEDPKLRVVVLGCSLGILGQAISNLVAPNFIQSWVLVVFAIMFGVNEVIFRWELSGWPRGA